MIPNQNNYILADNSVLRKKEILEAKDKIRLIDGVPIFTLVEFNIFGTCNRSCIFCPVSDPDFYKKRYIGISIDLYRKTMMELQQIDYTGTILFSAFCEPFMNKELPTLVALTKDFLPVSHLEIVSNGDIIKRNPSKLVELFHRGLDTICISVYDGPSALQEFEELRTRLNLSADQFIIKRRYYDETSGDYGMIISNRTNLVFAKRYQAVYENKVEQLPLHRKCFYPFYQTLIDLNGDMILCPHDWGKKYVLGNLKDTSIWQLWKCDKYQKARRLLSAKNRKFLPCRTCDVYGDIIGKENYDVWRKCCGS